MKWSLIVLAGTQRPSSLHTNLLAACGFTCFLFKIYQEVLGRTFMPLEFTKRPDGSSWKIPPTMQQRGSKFVKFQEARLQVRQHRAVFAEARF